MPLPLLRILWRLGIRLPPLPFMPFWQVTLLMGLMGHFLGMCNVVLSTGGRQEWWQMRPIIISITGGFCVRTARGLFPLVAQES